MPSLVESELFGHEKGAFTGADSKRRGAFEEANGGTLFLDEVGELPLDMQAKLLRVLESGEVKPVGANRPLHVDVRVVAATHRDLKEAARTGAFREDLYWRLNVVRIHLAPLRERPEDVLPLAERFLAKLGAQLGRRASGFTREASAALRACPWPGNVRQLANAIERALVLKGPGDQVGPNDLPQEVVSPDVGTASPASGVQGPLSEVLRAVEREHITLALKRARGVKSAAAEALGISRPTLDRKLEEYGINLYA
jgi:DNA-binding NtrC family response regulator